MLNENLENKLAKLRYTSNNWHLPLRVKVNEPYEPVYFSSKYLLCHTGSRQSTRIEPVLICLCLVSQKRDINKSTVPDQAPQNAAFDQGLYYLRDTSGTKISSGLMPREDAQ